jgi:glyoxylase-like metal-dependent hydrolase (beta-lactamase superfamily II)
VLFCGDLLVRRRDGRLGFVADEYMDAPEEARANAWSLLDLPIDALCPGHGVPIAAGAKDAIREALERDARARRRKAA